MGKWYDRPILMGGFDDDLASLGREDPSVLRERLDGWMALHNPEQDRVDVLRKDPVTVADVRHFTKRRIGRTADIPLKCPTPSIHALALGIDPVVPGTVHLITVSETGEGYLYGSGSMEFVCTCGRHSTTRRSHLWLFNEALSVMRSGDTRKGVHIHRR